MHTLLHYIQSQAHTDSTLQSLTRSHTLSHMQNTHIVTCLLFLRLSAPLTSEVVVEPRHQVEGHFPFRGGIAPYSLCHLVPQTIPRFLPVFMRTLRGHPRQPRQRLCLPLLLPLLSSPPLFSKFWGGVFKEIPGALHLLR